MQENDIMEDIGDIKSLRNKLMTIGISTMLLALFVNDIKDINFLFIKFKDGHEIFGLKTIICIVIANVFYLWRYYQKFRLLNFWNNKHMALEILKEKKKGKIGFINGDYVTCDMEHGSSYDAITDFHVTGDLKIIFLCEKEGGENLRGALDLMKEDFIIRVKKINIENDEDIELQFEKTLKSGGLDTLLSLRFSGRGYFLKWLRFKSYFMDGKYMDYYIPLFIPIIAIGMLLFSRYYIMQ